MRSLIALVSCLLALLVACSSAVNVAQAAGIGTTQGAMEVLRRLIPEHSSSFELTIDTGLLSTNPHFVPAQSNNRRPNLPNTTYDTFIVSATGGKVNITASSAVGLTSGAYWYLKNVTGCIVTWGNNDTGNQLSSIPATLPDVASTTIHSAVPWRYAWNTCTFSYSGVWWTPARWQKEIDWMALHGINMPLAFTGQEYIWVKLFAKFNVTLDQLQTWFTGPAFLTWQRFGNIRGFTNPLPMSWIVGQRDLQLGILTQMRSLGMTPVLPCFAGHLPAVAKTIWPNANFVQSSDWNNFPPNYSYVWFLDPTDAAYQEIGTMFAKMVIAEFGASGYYNCDTYNELDPSSSDPAFLANASKAVVTALRAADPTGIWVMQGWLFHSPYWNNNRPRVKYYLSGVPNDQMIILDLNSESGTIAVAYDQYFGKAWIWNMLLNFGGVRGVYGNMTRISTGPAIDYVRNGSTMLGIGFTPEAIENNPVMFELLTDTFWKPEPFNPVPWMYRYATQRYGAESSLAKQAWMELFKAVYNQGGEPRSEIEWVPNWEQPSFGWQNGNAAQMHKAALLYIAAAEEVPTAAMNGPYQYDLVDVARQATTMFFSDVHRVLDSVATEWTAHPDAPQNLRNLGDYMLDLISTIEKLLATNPNYLLGTWTQGAKYWADQTPAGTSPTLNTTKAEYLYGAKNQLTMWGPESQICDYAAKAWDGLYRTYYHKRWENMLNMMYNTSQPYQQNWNQYDYNNAQLTFEKTWNKSPEQFENTVKGTGADALRLAKSLMKKVSTNFNSSTFTAFAGISYQGGGFSYNPMWTSNTTQLGVLCSLTTSCAAYSTNSNLKKIPSAGLGQIDFYHTADNSSILFIKNSEVQLLAAANKYIAPGASRRHRSKADEESDATGEGTKKNKGRSYEDKWKLSKHHPLKNRGKGGGSKGAEKGGGSKGAEKAAFDPFHGANVGGGGAGVASGPKKSEGQQKVDSHQLG